MQGYFDSHFHGKKADIKQLLAFVEKRASEDEAWLNKMYSVIQQGMIELPENYTVLADNVEITISIGMSNSGNINFFDQMTYFSEMAAAVPALEMKGEYRLLDMNEKNTYISQAGTDKVDEEIVSLCRACGKEIDESEGYIGDCGDGEECLFCNKEEYMGFMRDIWIESITEYYDDEDIEYDEDELYEMSNEALEKLINDIFKTL